jgi:tetratricopeptide (TPR) repeat protein
MAARDLIFKGDTEQGLAELDLLAANTADDRIKAKILVLVGESESRLARYPEAIEVYSRAATLARGVSAHDELVKSMLGIVRSHLLLMQPLEARVVAVDLLDEVIVLNQDFEGLLLLTPEEIEGQQTPQVVPARPPRTPVVLTKIAGAFLDHGYVDDAKSFYHQAVVHSPNGASRARQALARIALASDEPETAERYARESLMMGRFQVKTISAWNLLIQARARRKLNPILDLEVYEAFRMHAVGLYASNALYQIAKALRVHGDPMWLEIAELAIGWPGIDPVLQTELEKIIHAEAKIRQIEPASQTAQRALELFSSPTVTGPEMISHAKDWVRFSLISGVVPEISPLLEASVQRHGLLHALSMRHAMALGAMIAERHDLARVWLEENLNQAVGGEFVDSWGRSAWALARMESGLGNKGQAAHWYMAVAAREETPARFKLQAMLRGLEHLSDGVALVLDEETETRIRLLLNAEADYRVVLDAARYLSLAPPSFQVLTNEAGNRGTALADEAYDLATAPSEKLGIIEYQARKLHWDLKRDMDVVKRWRLIEPAAIAGFKALGGSLWYEYLATVFRSMTRLSLNSEAEELAAMVIDQNQATPEGFVIVGSEYALWLVAQGQLVRAYGFFEWIAKEAPSHVRAAPSHYWIAVRSYSLGNVAQARDSALSVRRCYAGAPALLDDWKIEAKAIHLLKRTGDAEVPSGLPAAFIESQEPELDADLARMP